MIMDKEDGTIFTEALELHYIDMKAFAKAVNEANSKTLKKPTRICLPTGFR